MGESFFATPKTEFYYRRVRPTKKAARIAVGGWIEDRQNRRCRHASLDQITPVDFELQYSQQIADLKGRISRVHETGPGPDDGQDTHDSSVVRGGPNREISLDDARRAYEMRLRSSDNHVPASEPK